MTGVASWGKPGAFRRALIRASGGETPTAAWAGSAGTEVIAGEERQGFKCDQRRRPEHVASFLAQPLEKPRTRLLNLFPLYSTPSDRVGWMRHVWVGPVPIPSPLPCLARSAAGWLRRPLGASSTSLIVFRWVRLDCWICRLRGSTEG